MSAGNKKKGILDSMEVANQKKLEKHSLANVLQDTRNKATKTSLYKIVFPNKPWEQTFAKHCNKGEHPYTLYILDICLSESILN